MDRKRFRRRISRRSRSSNVSDVLNPDSNIIDEEHPLWWNELENDTMVTRQSARFNFAEHTANYLDSNSQLETSTPPDKWWEKLDKSERFSGNKTPLKRINNRSDTHEETNKEDSSEISEKDNNIKRRKPTLSVRTRSRGNDNFSRILHSSSFTVESESTPAVKGSANAETDKEDSSEISEKDNNIKRSKPTLSVQTRNRGSDNFSRILHNSSFTVESEPTPTINRRSRASLVSFLSDDKLLKPKRWPARNERKVEKSTDKNIYDNLLDDASTTAHTSVEKPITLSKDDLLINTEKEYGDSDDGNKSHASEKVAIKKSRPTFLKQKRVRLEEENFKKALSDKSSTDKFGDLFNNDAEYALLNEKRNLSVHSINQQNDSRNKDNSHDNESMMSKSSLSSLKDHSKHLSIRNPINQLNDSKNKDNSHDSESTVSESNLFPLKDHSKHLSKRTSETVLSKEISSSQAGPIQSGIHEHVTENDASSTSSLSQQNNSAGEIGNKHDDRFLKLQAILQQMPNRKSLVTNVSTDEQMSLSQSIDETPLEHIFNLQKVRKGVTSKAKNTLNTVQIKDAASSTFHASLHNSTSSKRSSYNKEFVDQSVVPRNNNVILEDEQSQIQKDDRNISETQTHENYGPSTFTSNSVMDTTSKRSKVSANDKSRHNLLQTSNVRLETGKDASDMQSQDIPEKATSSNELRIKDDAQKLSNVKKQIVLRQAILTPSLQISHNKKVEAMATELQKRKKKELTTLKDGKLHKYFKRTEDIPPAMQKLVDRNINLLKHKKMQLLGNQSKNIGEASAKQLNTVHKAYIVNGVVYKRPKLIRPANWVTNRLYHHLWKCMEPKYKNSTRVRSEKFVKELSKVVALTARRKKYENYKAEVKALMKEMARIGIINTRNDFYHFCQDFLPYKFRIKVVPTYIPGIGMNVSYNPNLLHTPIIDN